MFVKHLCPFPQRIRIGLTFDLLTWILIGVIYSSTTIYLPSMKLLDKTLLGYQLHKVSENDRHVQNNMF